MTLVLLLLAPLVEAAACGLLCSRRWMERVSVISAAVNLILGVLLVRNVVRFQSVSAFDGFLYADALSALVVVLTAFVSFVCAIYAVGYFRTDLEKQNHYPGKTQRVLHPDSAFRLCPVSGRLGQQPGNHVGGH